MSPALMDSTSAIPFLPYMRRRAELLQQVRDFFSTRAVLEVDCPALMPAPALDPYIDPFFVRVGQGEASLLPSLFSRGGWLHTSPEYAMKRLLAAGSGDIYQLGHVWREGEVGPRHNPEFTMIEWYRVGVSLSQLIDECSALIQLFTGEQRLSTICYREAFLRYASVDPFFCERSDLYRALSGCCSQEFREELTKEELLHLLYAEKVEPHLGEGGLTAIVDFPAAEAALARCQHNDDGILVAKRFEIYFQGNELANGYHELTDSQEQRQRFLRANELRRRRSVEELPLDEHFLAIVDQLPDCCGVACGFDRLLMILCKATSLADVFPFAWSAL